MVLFSFKYSIDLKYSHKAVAVEVAIYAKALTGCHGLAGSDLQDGGVPSEDWKVSALFEVNLPVDHLL